MTTIQDFKENAYQSVWDHAKRIFKPISVPVVLGIVLFYATIFALLSLFLIDYVEPYMTELSEIGPFDIAARNAIAESIFTSLPNPNAFMAIVVVLYLVFTIILSWFLNFFLIISESQILNLNENLGDQFKRSFNKNVLLITGSLVINYVFLYISTLILAYLLNITGSVALFVIGYILIILLSLRLFAVQAALVHGNLTLIEAFKFSWKNITLKRSAIILLICIGAGILIGVGLMVLGAIFSALGSIGNVILVIALILFYLFMISLFISSMSGIFFRYADVEIDHGDMNLEEHLVE